MTNCNQSVRYENNESCKKLKCIPLFDISKNDTSKIVFTRNSQTQSSLLNPNYVSKRVTERNLEKDYVHLQIYASVIETERNEFVKQWDVLNRNNTKRVRKVLEASGKESDRNGEASCNAIGCKTVNDKTNSCKNVRSEREKSYSTKTTLDASGKESDRNGETSCNVIDCKTVNDKINSCKNVRSERGRSYSTKTTLEASGKESDRNGEASHNTIDCKTVNNKSNDCKDVSSERVKINSTKTNQEPYGKESDSDEDVWYNIVDFKVTVDKANDYEDKSRVTIVRLRNKCIKEDRTEFDIRNDSTTKRCQCQMCDNHGMGEQQDPLPGRRKASNRAKHYWNSNRGRQVPAKAGEGASGAKGKRKQLPTLAQEHTGKKESNKMIHNNDFDI